jgi:hypothetical protein
MLSLAPPGASRGHGSDRRRRTGRCDPFRRRRDRTGRAATSSPSSTAVLGRRTVARHVRRLVRHVELPSHPPRRGQLFHEPDGPTQGSGPGAGPDLSRRQSASQGRPSAHQAARSRLPGPLSKGQPVVRDHRIRHIGFRLYVGCSLYCSIGIPEVLPYNSSGISFSIHSRAVSSR